MKELFRTILQSRGFRLGLFERFRRGRWHRRRLFVAGQCLGHFALLGVDIPVIDLSGAEPLGLNAWHGFKRGYLCGWQGSSLGVGI